MKIAERSFERAGASMIAFGLTLAGPMLAVIGVLVIVLTVWTRVDTSRHRDVSPGSHDDDA